MKQKSNHSQGQLKAIGKHKGEIEIGGLMAYPYKSNTSPSDTQRKSKEKASTKTREVMYSEVVNNIKGVKWFCKANKIKPDALIILWTEKETVD